MSTKLQCDDDPFYSNPKTMLGGCGCKTKCSDKSNRCSCQKNPARGNKCSAFTCRHCKCFKRQKESSEEDLVLSDQYQQLLDELSDTDSSEYEDDEDIETESLQEYDGLENLEDSL